LEQTLVLVKPDGVQRGLVGQVITRLEKRGLKLIAAKFLSVSKELAEKHYEVHKEKPFYKNLIRFITSAPVLAMVWEGPEAIKAVRQTMGATRPTEAAPGTIRHDFALLTEKNITHASDSPETAKFEIDLWFNRSELVKWDRVTDEWVLD
jgi:nucleoside-diphosphate kinase